MTKYSHVIIFLFFSSLASAEQYPVYISDFEPDVIIGEKVTGFGIDIWEIVSQKAGLDYQYHITEFKNIIPTLAQIKNCIGIAGISVTGEREKIIDYSQPYLNAGLSVVVRSTSDVTLAARIEAYKPLLPHLKTYLYFVLIMSHIVWFVDGFMQKYINRKEWGFSRNYFPGIFEAMYFCVVTCSTVGYGDYVTKRWLGRLCTLVLIIFGGIMFCNLTAILAADYTVTSLEGDIQSAKDLRGKQVGTLEGTTSVACTKTLKGIPVSFQDDDEMFKELSSNSSSLDAIIFDTPNIMYHLRKYPNLKIVDENFVEEHYAFALSENHPKREAIDRTLGEIREKGPNGEPSIYDMIYNKWF